MGSVPSWNNPDGFNCTDCHEPHGDPDGAVDVLTNPITNVYRNLRTDAGNDGSGSVNVSYAITTNDLTKDVYESNGPAEYSVNDVFFNEPADTSSPARSGMAEWCKKCHTNFHGDKGGTEVGGGTGVAWLRHPSAGADIGALQPGTHSDDAIYNAKTNKVKVMDPGGNWGSALDGNETPFCLSCHKAHGNQNAFGLIYMSGEGDVTEEGDDGTAARDLCHQCHGQGVPPTP
jgi:hypothetical protein